MCAPTLPAGANKWLFFSTVVVWPCGFECDNVLCPGTWRPACACRHSFIVAIIADAETFVTLSTWAGNATSCTILRWNRSRSSHIPPRLHHAHAHPDTHSHVSAERKKSSLDSEMSPLLGIFRLLCRSPTRDDLAIDFLYPRVIIY